MLALSRFFNWRNALVVVKPETFIKWHRTAFRAFWRWKSRKPGRPALPKNMRELVLEMARENPTWGQERIADELSLKLGILVSPRTVSQVVEERLVYLDLIERLPQGRVLSQKGVEYVAAQKEAQRA